MRFIANGLQLTITDFVAEVHDTHHPLSTNLYYEDQKEAAKQRSADFIERRIPKFMGYFERVLEQNPDGKKHAVGSQLSYVDLSLFQIFRRASLRLSARYKTLQRTISGADCLACCRWTAP